ncbi:MAG: iron ABC transporter permease [Candidatus Riflebacteria bacterium]|nr:iron ABC transporter permease [Candidatus Riflebacteria bacterium]
MRRASKYALFTGILLGLIYFSLNLGNFHIAPQKILAILVSKIFQTPLPEIAKYEDVVLLSLRLPRIIMVLLVGASLGVAGAVSQGIFRNPLVSPFILGVSSGASFGAGIAIVYFSQIPYAIDVLAALGGFVAVMAAFLIARHPGGFTPRLSLVLSGVIISSFFTSMVGILKYAADTDTQLPALTFWMMGSFGSIDWNSLNPVIYVIPVSLLLMVVFSWQLNILSMGDREASFLGMETEKWKAFFLFLVVVSVGSGVARCGVIGWVGLVIPHIARSISGPNHNDVLPLSAFLGAAFLLVADNIARAATSGEIPVGIITAIIGTPFFIYFLRKREAAIWS